jgi:hypothetical protein
MIEARSTRALDLLRRTCSPPKVGESGAILLPEHCRRPGGVLPGRPVATSRSLTGTVASLSDSAGGVS